MCTEKIKIEIDSQQCMLIERVLLLYRSRLLSYLMDNFKELSVDDEEFYRMELRSVKNLLDYINNKVEFYGKSE